MPYVLGNDLRIAVQALRTPYLAVQTDAFATPPPTIIPNPLWVMGSPVFPRSYVNIVDPSTSIIVQFGATNVAPSTRLSVYYGPEEDPERFMCDVSYGSTTTTLVACTLQRTSFDTGHRFTIYAGTMKARGTDVVNFLRPVVTGLTGCPTGGCPARGGSVVTVSGLNFVEPIYGVQIGTGLCTNITRLTSQNLTCVVPPGVGQRLAIVVNTDSVYSQAVGLLTYAPPAITGVHGCASSNGPLAATECLRTGQIITIDGYVLLGWVICCWRLLLRLYRSVMAIELILPIRQPLISVRTRARSSLRRIQRFDVRRSPEMV